MRIITILILILFVFTNNCTIRMGKQKINVIDEITGDKKKQELKNKDAVKASKNSKAEEDRKLKYGISNYSMDLKYHFSNQDVYSPYNLHSKLEEIYSEDIFSYYFLNGKYQTPLQKKAFKNTEEFKILKLEFEEQNRNIDKTEFIFPIFGKISEYNLKKKGFLITVQFDKNPVSNQKIHKCYTKVCNPHNICQKNTCNDELGYDVKIEHPNVKNGFFFEEFSNMGNKETTYNWFIEVPEEEALKIENTDAKFQVIFTVNKKNKITHEIRKPYSKLKLPNGSTIAKIDERDLYLSVFKSKIKRVEFINNKDLVYSKSLE